MIPHNQAQFAALAKAQLEEKERGFVTRMLGKPPDYTLGTNASAWLRDLVWKYRDDLPAGLRTTYPDLPPEVRYAPIPQPPPAQTAAEALADWNALKASLE